MLSGLLRSAVAAVSPSASSPPFIPPEPPDPPDVLLLAPLQILEPSISSPVPGLAATPRSFFATTSGLTGSILVSFRVQVSTTWRRFHSSPTFPNRAMVFESIFSVSSWNISYVDEHYLGLGISCVKMNHLPMIEDVVLSLNLLVPLVENMTSSLTLTQYEDLTLPQYEDVTLFYLLLVPRYEAGIRTFVLLALVSMVAEIEAFKNGGFGWSIHGRDEAHDSQDFFPYMVSTFTVQTLALKEALLSASLAGLSKLQVISDTNVFFLCLFCGWI
ncbi:hypothetical protein Bca52824_083815 [Brassica carinata]|uniref:Uncharacterized protein n=1 Tax=Brassica carinata TaxID=52824 RepID=A0A8X7TTZ9_BRACI|nr:hypothetical protein Bca52824_083815 [Brassica carinata]